MLVMPVFNEADCLEMAVAEWLNSLLTVGNLPSYKILLINDGSTDNSATIIDKLEKQHPEKVEGIHQKNGGHGSAIMAGYKHALESNAPFIFQTDSDNQFETKDFEKLWELRKESPVILGNRLNRADPKNRLFISWTLKQILRLAFGVKIQDANIPYRLYQRQWLQDNLAKIPSDSQAPNIMLSILAAQQNIDLKDLPVQHKPRETGQTVLISKHLYNLCLTVFKQLRAFKRGNRNGRS